MVLVILQCVTERSGTYRLPLLRGSFSLEARVSFSRRGVALHNMSGVSNPAMYSSGATNLVPEGQGGKTTDLELADHWPTCVNGWRSGVKDMFSRQPSVHHPNLVNGIGSI